MVKLNDILQDLEDYRPALGAVSARADGWRRWLDGRAAYIKKVRGLSASAAKQEAYQQAIVTFMNEMEVDPLGSDDCCAECGLGGVILPHLTGNGHVWLHHDCWQGFMDKQRREAKAQFNAVLTW
jgi:hypothetical protein